MYIRLHANLLHRVIYQKHVHFVITELRVHKNSVHKTMCTKPSVCVATKCSLGTELWVPCTAYAI